MFITLMIRVEGEEKDKTRKKCVYRVWNFRLDGLEGLHRSDFWVRSEKSESGSEYLGKDIPKRGNYKSKYLKMEAHLTNVRM